MNNSHPSVSVVIPALHAAGSINDAIDSVKGQTYGGIAETIVASGDEATSRVAREAGATVIDNPTGRTPLGLNLGIAAASGDIVVRLDAHAVLPPGYVARAVESLLRTGAVNVGGMQVPVGNTFWERAIAAAMSSPLGAGDARYRTGGEEGPVETVYLGVFLRERIDELGGFDTEFARNQDYELNHRIIEAGGVVWFNPELKVKYRPRGSLKELWRQYYQYGQAKRQFARRHPGSLRWRQLAPPTLVLALLSSLVAAPFWPWTLLVWAGYVGTLAVGVIVSSSANAGTIFALLTMHVAWGVGFLTGESSKRARTPTP